LDRRESGEKGMPVTSTSKRTRRIIAAGAFAVAAVAAPMAAAALSSANTSSDLARPACLAWFGNKEDGHCLSYSNGTPIVGGTPSIGYGPNNTGTSNGPGISTGPLVPGTIIDQPLA